MAIRIPLHPVALELLDRTGPLAVSSANLTGQAGRRPPARRRWSSSARRSRSTWTPARPQGWSPSTIVDVTAATPRVLRDGALDLARLREVVPDLLDLDGLGPDGLDLEPGDGDDG